MTCCVFVIMKDELRMLLCQNSKTIQVCTVSTLVPYSKLLIELKATDIRRHCTEHLLIERRIVASVFLTFDSNYICNHNVGMNGWKCLQNIRAC